MLLNKQDTREKITNIKDFMNTLINDLELQPLSKEQLNDLRNTIKLYSTYSLNMPLKLKLKKILNITDDIQLNNISNKIKNTIGKYNLEVSSAGIERKLKTLHHFICSVGEKVKIKEYSTEIFKGELIQASEDGSLKIKDDTQIYPIKFDDVLSASTYYEWKK